MMMHKDETMSDLYGIKEFGHLKMGLDARLLKQNINAANIANISTPGYKEKQVDFSKQLASAIGQENGIATTHPGHIANQTPVVRTVLDDPRIDGNTVNLDRVSVDDSMNGTEFTMLVNIYNMRSKELLSALGGK